MTPIKRAQMHQSGLNMICSCAVQFEFRYVKGVKLAPGFAVLTGSGTHAAVAADLIHKVQHEELLPEDEIQDRAVETVEEAVEENGGLSAIDLEDDEEEIGAEAAFGKAKDKAARLALVHHRHVAPKIRPAAWVGERGEVLSVNRRFSIDLDAFLRDKAKELHAQAKTMPKGYERRVVEDRARALNVAAKHGIDFAGEQDIVEEFKQDEFGNVLAIRDTKTARKSPTKTLADESDQLSGYSLASWVLDGRLPDYVALDYLVDLKSGAKHVIKVSTRSAHDMDVFLNRLINAVHAIRTGAFIPVPQTDWRCSETYCGYFQICPYARRPRTAPSPQLVQIAGAEPIEE